MKLCFCLIIIAIMYFWKKSVQRMIQSVSKMFSVKRVKLCQIHQVTMDLAVYLENEVQNLLCNKSFCHEVPVIYFTIPVRVISHMGLKINFRYWNLNVVLLFFYPSWSWQEKITLFSNAHWPIKQWLISSPYLLNSFTKWYNTWKSNENWVFKE